MGGDGLGEWSRDTESGAKGGGVDGSSRTGVVFGGHLPGVVDEGGRKPVGGTGGRLGGGFGCRGDGGWLGSGLGIWVGLGCRLVRGVVRLGDRRHALGGAVGQQGAAEEGDRWPTGDGDAEPGRDVVEVEQSSGGDVRPEAGGERDQEPRPPGRLGLPDRSCFQAATNSRSTLTG